jgi:hypothetical protein
VVETQKIAAGRRISVGDITLVPIVRTAASCRHGWHGPYGFGGKDVIAVVVLSEEPPRAIDVSGEAVAVQAYAEYVPELAGPQSGSRPAEPLG